LIDQQKKVENYVAKHDTLPLLWKAVLQPLRIERKQISDPDGYPPRQFKDTLLYSEETGSITPYRQLYFVVSYKQEHHLININQPTVITNDLFYAIVSSLLILVILLILFTYIIGYLLKKNIWKPLNVNLNKLHDYDLKGNTVLILKSLDIKEFDEINNVIMRMVDKINADYENSRIFTEDASHEMQTPLSIIKSKLDLLMQDKSLENNPEQAQAVLAMLRAVSRLSNLNKSLLLISKINNDQFEEKTDVDIRSLLEAYLQDFEELIVAKKLTVSADLTDCNCYMNSNLSEILISNLLSNAIRHNVISCSIEVILKNRSLIISNTSAEETDRSVNLFERLIRRGQLNESSGLGLNIVKSICEKNGFTVTYDYPEPYVFRIQVSF
jgi:signal transduction histidine kinase